MTRRGVTGAVLAGGSSTRFGGDKFLHPFGPTTMGRRAVEVLALAGVERVLVVSGNPTHDTAGADRVAGAREGNGPLGALVDTLGLLGVGTLVTLPCDVPYLGPSDVEALLDTCGDDVDVVLAESGGVHPTIGAWSVERCLVPLGNAYDAGERALHRAVSILRCVRVGLPAEHVRNVNTREDLAVERGVSAR